MSGRGKGQSGNQESEEEELKRLFLGIMEGYNDAAIPSLSYFSPPEIPSYEENTPKSRKRQRNESETSINERRRRDQMNENYSLLQSMVPSLDFKPSKERIVSDTVKYIKHLQEEAERLEGLMKFQRKVQKVERPLFAQCTNHNSVNVTVSDSATFLAVQLPFRRGSVLDILKVLEKHQAEVMDARFDVNDEKVLTFTATVRLGSGGASAIDKLRQDLLTSLALPY
ncbi:hypothetical protein C2S51_026551 [Perilla frutescens var. frutescens]|nr:hypothetical protein C2S51_026551 [Perilla frutescens var. frutescens]